MSLWSTQLLKHFLYSRCGVAYSGERVRQWFHELGFRQRRLRHRHLRADPEEQAAFVID
jgi:transposase